MAVFLDINKSYDEVAYNGIQYTNCRGFDHLSRYNTLRQVVHNYDEVAERFVALETPNEFATKAKLKYYTVSSTEENRLDLLAHKYLGSAQYSWVIARINGIEDNFSVRAGQVIAVPESITALLASGEILGTVNALSLNLGVE